MAKKRKWRFAKGREDTRIVIPAMRINLSKENFKDETVETLLKEYGDRYKHNFELNEGKASSEGDGVKLNAKERAKLAKSAESLEDLDQMTEGEEAKTVLEAIEKRREELIALEEAEDSEEA